eukprot:CAMPEP_0184662300 /NCGR_PEP_ID=MMETSP0308-20130426/42514_1 /TAXON_ID=38269 /ORGANISM="Gloeochaete witrockiana, Strain SAG 46.84" /LENGTH=189 /DNA_ID=CAMNT_0027104205 /DNA_START=46 /DNA_END=615 /DNA_ORIENTATION=+
MNQAFAIFSLLFFITNLCSLVSSHDLGDGLAFADVTDSQTSSGWREEYIEEDLCVCRVECTRSTAKRDAHDPSAADCSIREKCDPNKASCPLEEKNEDRFYFAHEAEIPEQLDDDARSHVMKTILADKPAVHTGCFNLKDSGKLCVDIAVPVFGMQCMTVPYAGRWKAECAMVQGLVSLARIKCGILVC